MFMIIDGWFMAKRQREAEGDGLVCNLLHGFRCPLSYNYHQVKKEPMDNWLHPC